MFDLSKIKASEKRSEETMKFFGLSFKDIKATMLSRKHKEKHDAAEQKD